MNHSILLSRSVNDKAPAFDDGIPSDRLTKMNVPLLNRHDVSIIWLDTKIDPDDDRTQQLLARLGDRVQLINDLRDCLNMLYERLETILLIVSGKCAEQCLRSIHSLSTIDSIIIYCASRKKYQYLTTGAYVKVSACIDTEAELIQCVHTWTDLKCQTHFYTWNKKVDEKHPINSQTALFLANYLLPGSIRSESYWKHRQDMLNSCRAYYGQRESEVKHILEFELTYTETDAIMWYTRDSFVHKLVNRSLRSFDSNNLRAIAFYIHDLRAQLKQWRLRTNTHEITTVYHGLVMPVQDVNRIKTTPVGSLLSINGFLSTSRKREIATAFAAKKQGTISGPLHNVLLEINLDVQQSPVVFADVSHVSEFPEEGEILFDLGTVLCLQSVEYDEDIELSVIKLSIVTNDDYKLIEQLVASVRCQLDEQNDNGAQKSLIGKLLDISSQSDVQLKKHEDAWYKFSLFRSSFTSVWYTNQDKYVELLEQYMPQISKLVKNYFHYHDGQIEKRNSKKSSNLLRYYEPPLARFEPVLVFILDDESIGEERIELSTIFSLQYRRFATQHLTVQQANDLLDEFYLIFYVAPRLPADMRDNGRIKFYEFSSSVKARERAIGQLLLDLGTFYPSQMQNLPQDQQAQLVADRLKAKTADCYRKLTIETQKIIRRYDDEEREELAKSNSEIV